MECVSERVRNRFNDVSELDGVKYFTGDANVLIRSSGSSPKVRIVAESMERSEAEDAMRDARKMVRKC